MSHKTDKNKLFHALDTKGVFDEPPEIEHCIFVVDGMAYFQVLSLYFQKPLVRSQRLSEAAFQNVK